MAIKRTDTFRGRRKIFVVLVLPSSVAPEGVNCRCGEAEAAALKTRFS